MVGLRSPDAFAFLMAFAMVDFVGAWILARRFPKLMATLPVLVAIAYFAVIPSPYEWLLEPPILLGWFWLCREFSFRRTGKRANLAIAVPLVFAALCPVMFNTMNLSGSKVFKLQARQIDVTTKTKVFALNRQDLDISYERAWLGNELYWDLADKTDETAIVSSREVYWTGRFGLITGDEVAHRISEWSNTKPRHIINGESRDWVKPTRLHP
jgi:hypothetical protein